MQVMPLMVQALRRILHVVAERFGLAALNQPDSDFAALA